MSIDFIVSSIVLGFLVAIPPGPVTIIACQRALQFGFKNSLFFTLGSSTSDVFYILLAYIGVANVIGTNFYFKIILWIFCGSLLIALGLTSIIGLLKSDRNENGADKLQANPVATFISGLLITLTNPLTIVGWIAIAGNFFLIWNDRIPQSRRNGIMTIFLIMFGVFLWFLPLIYIVSKFKKVISVKAKRYLIVISNSFLVLFGISAFYYAFATFNAK
jgi:threonine/homoserine/homoserine lactone efflux protein